MMPDASIPRWNGPWTRSFCARVALLALCSFCWLFGVPSDALAQTYIHTEKVQVKPRTTTDSGDADVFRIWGGLQAGPNGNIQVINADGTIAGSSAIADGTITFAKWASNSCALGNIPQWDGSAWVCGTVTGAGGLGATDNAVITGSWRFTTNTLFGDSTTAQQLVHVYKSGAAAAVRIEQGGSAWWDLTSTGTSLTIGTNSGTVGTLTTTGLGILKTPATALDVNGTATVTGLAVNGTIGSHLIPTSPDLYDIGSSEKLWRQAYISQLNAVVFAEQTATLLGGYTIIAKDAGAFDQGVASGATAIDFGKAMTPGHFVLVRAHDTAGVVRAEYLQVGALVGGTIYNVTRDLAAVSSPDPTWPDGTPFMVLGSLGDGRIELNAYNTPKISFMTQGATFNAQTEPFRLGALDGMPGVPAGKFGLYVGDTTTAGLSFYDSTLLVRGEVRATSGWFGNDSAQGVQIDSTGLSVGSAGAIRSSSVTYGTGTGYFLGVDAGIHKFRVGSTTNYLRWNGSTLQIAADGSGLTNINGGNIQTGTIVADAIAAGTISATQIAAGSITADRIQANSLTATQIASSAITTDELAANSVTATHIQASAITGTKISADAITSDKIAAGTIQASDIGVGTITADRIASGTITSSQIQAGSINADRLNVTTLSAISANLGNVTAGEIGIGSGAITIDGNGLIVDDNARIQVGSGVTLDNNGLSANGVTINGSGIGVDNSNGCNYLKFDVSAVMSFEVGNGCSGQNVQIGFDGIVHITNSISASGATALFRGLIIDNGGSNFVELRFLSGGGSRNLCVDNSGIVYASFGGC